MQNKPNFQDAQMNVSNYLQKAYENIHNWTLGENKPNSNPIRANFNAYQAQTNPIKACPEHSRMGQFQTQSNPIS